MKQPAWSHSALKDFEGCQRRYQEVKVLKNYPFTETEATRYGNQVHKAIEDYIGEGKPIPAEYSQFQPVVDAMLKKNGRKLAEYEMALTVDLKPTGSTKPSDNTRWAQSTTHTASSGLPREMLTATS